MSVYLKTKDYVRVVLEGEVGQVFETGNFFVGNNLIERDLASFVSVAVVDRSPAVGDVLAGRHVINLVKPGTVIQTVSSGTLWFLVEERHWMSNTGASAQGGDFFRQNSYRVVLLP